MKLLFWLSFFLVSYTYLLYPAWLFFRSKVRPKPVKSEPIFAKVSVVIAVRNEGAHIDEKLANLHNLDYPKELLEILVVSDGSTDQTNEVLGRRVGSEVRSIILQTHVGKAEALNRALGTVAGEIVVFMDARQRIAIDALRVIIGNFADPRVGCVSGALMLEKAGATATRGVGSYWEMEKSIRLWESLSGSSVGATGALYAVRRSLIPHLPEGLILDDVFIPMEVVRRGARVIFEPRAIAWDNLPVRPLQEFRRKVRTLFGNYQLLHLAPWLLKQQSAAIRICEP